MSAKNEIKLPNNILIVDEEYACQPNGTKQVLAGEENYPADPTYSIAHLVPIEGSKPLRYQMWVSSHLPVEFAIEGELDYLLKMIGQWKLVLRPRPKS